MTASVLVTPRDGRFTACILGSPEVNAVGDSATAAVSALEVELDRRNRAGELRLIELPPVALSDRVGTYSAEEKELLREIAAEAYRLRDEEKAREFPE